MDFILKPQLVKTLALMGVGFERAPRFVFGQLVGRLVFADINTARHQRFVGVAFEEFHHHFHANTRDDHAAPARLARFWLTRQRME